MSFVKNILFALFASSFIAGATENLVTLHVTPRDQIANQSTPMNIVSRLRLLQKIDSELKQKSWLASKAKFAGKNTAVFSYNSEKASEKEVAALFSTTSLTIHKTHSDNYMLIEKIAKGDAQLPEGYKIYTQDIKDMDGQVIGTRDLLVTEKPALTEKDIQMAWPDRGTNSMVFIELNDEGAKKMEAFTKALKPGKDLIVTIFEGKAINAATLQAEFLSKYFAISGLDNLEECETLAQAITPPFKYDLKIRSITPVVKPVE